MATDPTEVNRLRLMISHFRVSELTSLLQSQNRPKTGRKRELMDRALEMLDIPITESLRSKIVELDQHRNPAQSRGGYGVHGFNSEAFQMNYGSNYGSGLPGLPITSPAGPFPKAEPGVKFRPLAFFDQIELIQKTAKVPGNGTRPAGTTFSIRIPETAMKKFKEGQSSSREQYCFLIRFADMNGVHIGKNILSDEIPTSLKLKVNDKDPELPPHIPPSKAGVDPKRQKRPIKITSQIRSLIEKGVSSRLSYIDITVWAQWKEEGNQGKSWGISLELGEQINSDILLSRVRKSTIPREETIRIVKEKLDPNSDVATTSLRVKLLCPVGCSRMTVPTRTNKCKHLQCFDSGLYLKMNEKKPTWKCPVCDIEAYFTDLIVDEYFIEICRESKTEEVDFCESGGWKEHQDKKEKENQVKERKREKQIVQHSVTLVDSDDDEDGPATNVPSGALAPNVKTKSQEDVCIILSSDEEDIQPQPKRARLEHSAAGQSPSHFGERREASRTGSGAIEQGGVVIIPSDSDEDDVPPILNSNSSSEADSIQPEYGVIQEEKIISIESESDSSAESSGSDYIP